MREPGFGALRVPDHLGARSPYVRREPHDGHRQYIKSRTRGQGPKPEAQHQNGGVQGSRGHQTGGGQEWVLTPPPAGGVGASGGRGTRQRVAMHCVGRSQGWCHVPHHAGAAHARVRRPMRVWAFGRTRRRSVGLTLAQWRSVGELRQGRGGRWARSGAAHGELTGQLSACRSVCLTVCLSVR